MTHLSSNLLGLKYNFCAMAQRKLLIAFHRQHMFFLEAIGQLYLSSASVN